MRPIVDCGLPRMPLYPMVKLTTKGGREITLTTESLFGLIKYDGAPVLRVRRSVQPLKPTQLRFDLPQSERFDYDDPRYWYVVGLVTSGGNLPAHPTHAACLYYPSEREWEFHLLQRFLDQYFEQFELESFPGRYPKTVVAPGPFGVSLTSKMINMIAHRLSQRHHVISSRLFDKAGERSLFFMSGMVSDENFAGFMAGVLAGMTSIPEGRKFFHRNSRLVRILADLLWTYFGIPTELAINPHEDIVKWNQRGSVNEHHFILRREHYLKVQDAGLAHWDQDYILRGGEQAPLEYHVDPVASIEAVGFKHGTVLEGRKIEEWDRFLFQGEFEPNDTALDIATMKELFTEVDPNHALVSTPNMSQGAFL